MRQLEFKQFRCGRGIALVFRDHFPQRAKVSAGRRPVGLFEIVSSRLGSSQEWMCAAIRLRPVFTSTDFTSTEDSQ